MCLERIFEGGCDNIVKISVLPRQERILNVKESHKSSHKGSYGMYYVQLLSKGLFI